MRRPAAVALAVFASTALAALTPQPAYAANEISVSADNVTFSSTYPGTLFDSISYVVPGDADQEFFYIRNDGSEAGRLRVILRDTTVTNTDFANALTLTASTTGYAGVPATLLEADPCWVLLEGPIVNPGNVVRVSTTLALGDLFGQAGQSTSAQFSINASLTSSAVQLPPTSCGGTGSTVVIPGLPGGTSGSAQNAGPGAGALDSIPTTAPEPEVNQDLPVLSLPALLGIDPNTWRLFEEYFVFVLMGGFVVGAGWFAFIAWRRRKNEPEAQISERVDL